MPGGRKTERQNDRMTGTKEVISPRSHASAPMGKTPRVPSSPLEAHHRSLAPIPQETETKEFESLVRLRLITHNARLVDARKERAMTGEDMAQAAGIVRYRLGHIENLRVVPTEEEIAKIACVLEKSTDYLFPETLLDAVQAGVFSRRKAELATPQIISLTEASRLPLMTDGDEIEREVDRKWLVERVKQVLTTLTPREQSVLTLRFGLDGGGSRTLEEVGRQFKRTRETIRHIEWKALHKLRHPSRSKKLKDFLG